MIREGKHGVINIENEKLESGVVLIIIEGNTKVMGILESEVTTTRRSQQQSYL